MSDRIGSPYARGALYGLAALCIWASFIVVSRLGVRTSLSSAAFVAMTPVMTGLMAIPVLGEWPSVMDWAAISLISIGVYVVSGGPLPHRIMRARPAA